MSNAAGCSPWRAPHGDRPAPGRAAAAEVRPAGRHESRPAALRRVPAHVHHRPRAGGDPVRLALPGTRGHAGRIGAARLPARLGDRSPQAIEATARRSPCRGWTVDESIRPAGSRDWRTGASWSSSARRWRAVRAGRFPPPRSPDSPRSTARRAPIWPWPTPTSFRRHGPLSAPAGRPGAQPALSQPHVQRPRLAARAVRQRAAAAVRRQLPAAGVLRFLGRVRAVGRRRLPFARVRRAGAGQGDGGTIGGELRPAHLGPTGRI